MRCASEPGTTSQGCAPSRIVPPMSEVSVRFSIEPSRFCHSVISATTGCGVAGSNSVLLALGKPGHVARAFDHGELHAEADAEVGNAVLARQAHGLQLALDAALAEASRHQDRVHAAQAVDAFAFQHLGVDVVDVDLRARVHAGVGQRLGQRLVRFRQVDILADHRDVHFVLRMLERVDQLVPDAEVGRFAG